MFSVKRARRGVRLVKPDWQRPSEINQVENEGLPFVRQRLLRHFLKVPGSCPPAVMVRSAP
jgi:hypothetical protein